MHAADEPTHARMPDHAYTCTANHNHDLQAKVVADGKPGFFAVASAPSESSILELLIKTQPGSAAEAINALSKGAELMVSAVQGKGFPIDKIPASEVDTVLMFGTGSGISPLKAVMESGALGSRKHIRLFYGTKSKGEAPASSFQGRGELQRERGNRGRASTVRRRAPRHGEPS